TDRNQRSEILKRVLALAEKHYRQEPELSPGKHISDLEMDTLPDRGEGALETLDLFDSSYSAQVTGSAGPRYFGFVTGGSTPASVAGDWLVSIYDQNACGSN